MAVLTWMGGLGRQGLAGLLRILFAGEPSAGEIQGGAWRGVGSGATVERSMSRLLGVLNLPSKTDYNRLLSKVEVLQGSLMNLNIKVDRLLAMRERPRREPPDEQGSSE